MKNLVYFITLISFSTLFTSCKDIIAEDITNRTPVLIIPTISDTVMTNPVQFKWEEMVGATKYHLQVVSPSFSAISDYVIDTIVYGTNFSFPLDSAGFELKLTALNGGYTSQTLGPVPFWVGLSPTVNTTTIVLQSPADAIYVNGSYNGSFQWQAMTGATSYEFSLRKGSSFATGNIEHTQNNIGSSPYSLPGSLVLSEGQYYWGVKGYTTTGETLFSTRSFRVDTTSPNTPTLISPTSLDLLSTGIITFSWSNGTDGGTIHAPVHSIIEISSDIDFLTLVETDNIVGNSIDFDLLPGTYYWRVINIDEVGNSSVYSAVIQIVVS